MLIVHAPAGYMPDNAWAAERSAVPEKFIRNVWRAQQFSEVNPATIGSLKMKYPVLIAVSLVALSLGGCGKKDETAPAGMASDALASEAAPAAALSPGQTFANAAAASDAFEIEASQLAETKATSAKVKSFAAQMIKAHTDSTAKLKTAAAAASPAIVPDTAFSDAQRQTLTDLGGKSGGDFDAAYAKAQVDAHQATLDALKAYSANGEVASLKAFATELVPTVIAHLNMAKGLK
jgi:putative membrane protein